MAIYNGGLNIIAPDTSGKEDKSNKVSSWSSTTTDAHYPSEKLVKDALDTKVNTTDVLTYEKIMASTDLTGKIASAGALKKAAIREKHYMDMTVDSAGNIYFVDIPTATNIILSIVSPQNYTFGLALYSDGSRYYAKVFRADGTLAVGETIAHVYVHYFGDYGL